MLRLSVDILRPHSSPCIKMEKNPRKAFVMQDPLKSMGVWYLPNECYSFFITGNYNSLLEAQCELMQTPKRMNVLANQMFSSYITCIYPWECFSPNPVIHRRVESYIFRFILFAFWWFAEGFKRQDQFINCFTHTITVGSHIEKVLKDCCVNHQIQTAHY